MSINLKNNPKHQGKFHLLAIFGIPTSLIILFVVENIYLFIGYVAVLALISWYLFKKSN